MYCLLLNLRLALRVVRAPLYGVIPPVVRVDCGLLLRRKLRLPAHGQ